MKQVPKMKKIPNINLQADKQTMKIDIWKQIKMATSADWNDK